MLKPVTITGSNALPDAGGGAKGWGALASTNGGWSFAPLGPSKIINWASTLVTQSLFWTECPTPVTTYPISAPVPLYPWGRTSFGILKTFPIIIPPIPSVSIDNFVGKIALLLASPLSYVWNKLIRSLNVLANLADFSGSYGSVAPGRNAVNPKRPTKNSAKLSWVLSNFCWAVKVVELGDIFWGIILSVNPLL